MWAIKLAIIALTVLSASVVSAGDSIDCAYLPKSSKAGQLCSVQEYRNCGTNLEGKMSLSKKHLLRMHYDRYGLATIFIQGQYYYVKADGSMLPVIGYDNWADDYSEGLVRSSVDGKIAYYDRSFKQIIAPKYDGAWPFKKGRALVCTDCKRNLSDEEGHTMMTGGLWGYINKKGEEIIPVRYTRKEAEQM